MLFSHTVGHGGPRLYFLHFLGGATSDWLAVSDYLERDFTCVYIDLPGFGGSSTIDGYSVMNMAKAVRQCIVADAPEEWMLVGHSMGAKVAAVIARQAESQAGTKEQDLRGLKGLVLLAGSPPSPEPIPDDRREEMKRWFKGDRAKSREQAYRYIDNNAFAPIDDLTRERVVDDVLRMNTAAWLAWLELGSKEDWAERVGVLQTPTLILAGERDEDLGADAQQRWMLPHFSQARILTVPGAKHLLPLEFPAQVAKLIANHSNRVLGKYAPSLHPPGLEYQALIHSDRVSEKTRQVLVARAQFESADYIPRVLTTGELATLRAMIARVLPQDGSGIDLAQYIDKQLEADGDGWRFALLPEDKEAYRHGLETLNAWAQTMWNARFDVLDETKQDELLSKLSSGTPLGNPGSAGISGRSPECEDRSTLNTEQMTLWFQDLQAVAVKAYISHPMTLDRIGYSGIGDGGNAGTMRGFVLIGTGETESWEPESKLAKP